MKQIPLIVPRRETVQIFEPSKFQLVATNLNLVSKITLRGQTHNLTHVVRRKNGFPKQLIGLSYEQISRPQKNRETDVHLPALSMDVGRL